MWPVCNIYSQLSISNIHPVNPSDASMKAVVYTKYGTPEVLQIKDIDIPNPKDNEILLRVYAATVNRTDFATIHAIPFFARIVTGLFKPKQQTPGSEFSGKVERIGKNVTEFKVGDKVFGFDDLGAGSQAEYKVVTTDKAVLMPENIGYQRAAASSEGAHYAYNAINKIDLKQGQRALVYGASGAIGSAAVQLLKYFGLRVTAVSSTRHQDLLQSLGADITIDYTKQDFTRDELKYDLVLDAVGKVSFFKCKHLLRSGGVYVSTDLGYMSQNILLPMITPLIKPLLGNKKTISPFPTNIKGSLLLIKALMEQGRFEAVIDRDYKLEQIKQAYEYVGKAGKTGNVVININPC